ncbi:MAG: hypothetical protein UX81_C0008G0006 [Parcubacteria group bacterium GW2011_GWA2_47_12]|nr:MAG: hypothetical protein UX81_C0008G0006 [Parcubacteria group bacterium GW2011_GWA2_47_12]
MHPAKEVNSKCNCFNKYFVGVQCEVEFFGKKTGNVENQRGKIFFVLRENHKIICVPDVVWYFELMFCKSAINFLSKNGYRIR